MTAVLAALLRNDLRLLGRDRFLATILIWLPAVALLLRLAIPRIERQAGLSLEPYHGLIGGYFAVLLGPMIGVVLGFLVLEGREDRTLRALLVTPLPPRLLVGYRIATALLLGGCVTTVELLLLGLRYPPPVALLPILGAASLGSALAMVYVPVVADNKVQAFAMMKILSALSLLPLGAWFVAEPWQFAAGVYPPYWVLKAYWAAGTGDPRWPGYLATGVLSEAALLAFLIRRFLRVARR